MRMIRLTLRCPHCNHEFHLETWRNRSIHDADRIKRCEKCLEVFETLSNSYGWHDLPTMPEGHETAPSHPKKYVDPGCLMAFLKHEAGYPFPQDGEQLYVERQVVIPRSITIFGFPILRWKKTCKRYLPTANSGPPLPR